MLWKSGFILQKSKSIALLAELRYRRVRHIVRIQPVHQMLRPQYVVNLNKVKALMKMSAFCYLFTNGVGGIQSPQMRVNKAQCKFPDLVSHFSEIIHYFFRSPNGF